MVGFSKTETALNVKHRQYSIRVKYIIISKVNRHSIRIISKVGGSKEQCDASLLLRYVKIMKVYFIKLN